jgi:hypothetical protein
MVSARMRGASRSLCGLEWHRVAPRRFAPSLRCPPFITAGAAPALILAATLLTAPGAATAAAQAKACRPATVQVRPGATVTLRLDCRVAVGKRLVARARGRRGGAVRTLVGRPDEGVLGRLDRRSGRVRYTARATASGTDTVRFRVRLRDGRRYRGAIRIRIVRRRDAGTPPPPAARPPAPAPAPPRSPAPAGDGLPSKLPPVPGSVAATTRNWQPTAYDTCPAAVHERFSVVGPDGRRYPTWHAPSVTDPATGRPCTFGHEHGADPRTSDIHDRAARHFAAAAYPAHAGLPFGLAAEALNAWSDATGTPRRSEDHVGYKVEVQDDIALLGTDGAALGVTCDHLTVVHQGSHSADALSNNVHELLYAVRCDDGTELIADTISRFGNPGEYTRSCDPGVRVPTTDNGYPGGDGERRIPDRECAERDVLVGPGETTSAWALYERWSSANALTTAGGATLASFDTAFGVFDPSRYAQVGGGIGRTLALCAEVTPGGRRAAGGPCAGPLPAAFDDPTSPLDGTRRDVYLAGTTVRNAGGPGRWWTDPYGGNASAQPFPGAVCQLVAATDNAARPPVRQRVFNRNTDHDAAGVHAPN